jgi:hypothetical protein
MTNTTHAEYILDGWLSLNREALSDANDLTITATEGGYAIHAGTDSAQPLVSLNGELAERYHRIGALLAVSNLILTAQREKNSHIRVAQLYKQVDDTVNEYGFTDEDLHTTMQGIAERYLAAKRSKV